MINLCAYSFFVATAGWVVLNFLYIVFRGQTIMGFESYALNIAELVLAVAVFGFAIERWVSSIKRLRR